MFFMASSDTGWSDAGIESVANCNCNAGMREGREADVAVSCAGPSIRGLDFTGLWDVGDKGVEDSPGSPL